MVPEPPLLEPPELPDDPLVLELLLLEPHAATASAEASAIAIIAIRLGFKVTSPSLGVRQVSGERPDAVLSTCEPIVGVLCWFG